MKNIEEVRDELSEVFQGLKDGTLEVDRASEMNNTAGKIIKSLAVQLEYFSLRNEQPDLDYMKSTHPLRKGK